MEYAGKLNSTYMHVFHKCFYICSINVTKNNHKLGLAACWATEIFVLLIVIMKGIVVGTEPSKNITEMVVKTKKQYSMITILKGQSFHRQTDTATHTNRKLV
jgi:hypothetical protein